MTAGADLFDAANAAATLIEKGAPARILVDAKNIYWEGDAASTAPVAERIGALLPDGTRVAICNGEGEEFMARRPFNDRLRATGVRLSFHRSAREAVAWLLED